MLQVAPRQVRGTRPDGGGTLGSSVGVGGGVPESFLSRNAEVLKARRGVADLEASRECEPPDESTGERLRCCITRPGSLECTMRVRSAVGSASATKGAPLRRWAVSRSCVSLKTGRTAQGPARGRALDGYEAWEASPADHIWVVMHAASSAESGYERVRWVPKRG